MKHKIIIIRNNNIKRRAIKNDILIFRLKINLKFRGQLFHWFDTY